MTVVVARGHAHRRPGASTEDAEMTDIVIHIAGNFILLFYIKLAAVLVGHSHFLLQECFYIDPIFRGDHETAIKNGWKGAESAEPGL